MPPAPAYACEGDRSFDDKHEFVGSSRLLCIPQRHAHRVPPFRDNDPMLGLVSARSSAGMWSAQVNALLLGRGTNSRDQPVATEREEPQSSHGLKIDIKGTRYIRIAMRDLHRQRGVDSPHVVDDLSYTKVER
jgi:hypothetical protein